MANLTEHQRHTLLNALRCAADEYEIYRQDYTKSQQAFDLAMAAQFNRQQHDVRELMQLIEQADEVRLVDWEKGER